ncbi:DUF624 domain-containing protein [Halalkalibacterium halodurans]|nr:DUF624 domain-containing protein [Halalkalibacterium halodurans]TPE70967.1 DUF624 domain-containing protein [Halalkalibacterium halodurans]
MKKVILTMNEDNPYTKIMKLFEWIMRLVYLNLLWLLFSFIGGIILGVMPATASLFAVFRKWYQKEDDFPLFQTYLNEFKRSFKIANLVGQTLVLIGGILYLDVLLLLGTSHWMGQLLLMGVGALSFIYLVTLLYIFPTLVHFDLSYKQYFKHSFLLGVLQPFRTLLLMITLSLSALLFLTFPILLPLFAASFMAALTMWSFLFGYKKLADRYEHMKKTEPN